MEQASRTPLLRVVLLYVAGLCAAGQFAKVSVMFPALRAAYPEAGAELGFLVSLLSLVGIVLGLFAGLVVARIGFRRVLLAALVAGAVISLYQASMPPLWLMLVSRAVEGAAHLAIVVAAPTLIVALSEKRHHPLVMTLWSTYFGVAFALATWLGLPLVAASGPQAVFLAHALLLACVAALLFFLLPHRGLPTARPADLSLAGILRRHAEVYASPSMAAPAAGFVFYTLTYVSLLTLLPDYIDPHWRALVAGAMPLASIAASLLSGAILLRRFSAVSAVIGGFAFGALIAVLLMIMPGDPILCILLYVALGIIQSASFASIPELNARSEEQALANGAVAQTGNIGNMVGTPVLIALASLGGFPVLIGAVALAHIAGAAVHLVLRSKRA